MNHEKSRACMYSGKINIFLDFSVFQKENSAAGLYEQSLKIQGHRYADRIIDHEIST